MVDWRYFHRSYEIYDSTAPKYVKEAQDFDRRLPMNMRMGKMMVDAKYRDKSRKAYRLDPTGLSEVRILPKEGQDFSRYASAFERSRSALCGHKGCDPVVDEKGNVVAHLAWFRAYDIFFDRFVGGADSNGEVIVDPFDADGDGWFDAFNNLNDALEQGCEVRVAATRKGVNKRGQAVTHIIAPDSSVAVGYTRDAALGQETILLLVDPNGKVLYEAQRRSLDGVESHWMDITALVGIGQLGFKVVRGVVGFALSRGASATARIVLSRQAARTAAQQSARTTSRGIGAVGPNPGRVTSRGMGAVGPTPGRALSPAEAAATQRMTARGMGAVGPAGAKRVTSRGMGIPPRPPGPVSRPVPRIGPSGRPELPLDEMEVFVKNVIQDHAEVAKLLHARNLSGDALRNELMAAVRAWEARTGQTFEIVPRGAVQRLTGEARNFATIRNGKLMIEEQVVQNLKKFHEELVHEFCAHALGGRVARIFIQGHTAMDALMILEHWVKVSGSFDFVRRLLSP